MRDVLTEYVSAQPAKGLLRLYLRYMTRKRTDFDAAEIAADHNWANASVIRQYAAQLDRHWESFVGKLRQYGIDPELPWSPDAEEDERLGESDKRILKAELDILARKLETSQIINPT